MSDTALFNGLGGCLFVLAILVALYRVKCFRTDAWQIRKMFLIFEIFLQKNPVTFWLNVFFKKATTSLQPLKKLVNLPPAIFPAKLRCTNYSSSPYVAAVNLAA